MFAETNALRRDRGLEGEQETMSDVKRVWERENVGDRAGYDGRQCRMDIDGWRHERRTLRIETARNATASWMQSESARTGQATINKSRTWATHSTSHRPQMTHRSSEPATLPRTTQDEAYNVGARPASSCVITYVIAFLSLYSLP